MRRMIEKNQTERYKKDIQTVVKRNHLSLQSAEANSSDRSFRVNIINSFT